MSSLPEINQLPFENAEPSPVPQRLPNIGSVQTLGPHYNDGTIVYRGNWIEYPTLSANAAYPAGGFFNGQTGGLSGWNLQSPVFFNRPYNYEVFAGKAYLENYKSLSGVNEDYYTYMDVGTGANIQPRIVKLYGNGTDFSNTMSSELNINRDLKRWNLASHTPMITHFTTNSGTINGIAYPQTNFWTSYRHTTFFDVKGAGVIEFGCWVRCPKDDLFRLYNFGGFSITMESNTSGTTNQNQQLLSYVAVFSRTDNTIVSAGAFPENLQSQTLNLGGGGSYYHNSNLSCRLVTGVVQQAFPATKTCKYYYFNAEDFGEFTKISIRIPDLGHHRIGTKLGVFDLFFAESTTYLDVHDGVNTGSIEFYSPYVNSLTQDGRMT